MPKPQFEVYETESFDSLDFTEQSGRYAFQATAERRVLADVVAKLQPRPEDTLLDVGCGPGNLLIPLSFMVASATGVDGAAVVGRLGRRFVDTKIRLAPGIFPDVELQGEFTRILSYSVLHYCADVAAAQGFLLAIARRLAPGGRALVADLPNRSAKVRAAGAADAATAFQSWNKDVEAWKQGVGGAHPFDEFAGRSGVGNFSDEDIAGFIVALRGAGYDAYWLPQSSDLPFGRTREDILIVRR